VVHVEVRSLGAFGQDLLLLRDGLIEIEGRVADVLHEPAGVPHILLEHRVLVHQRCVIEALEQEVRFAHVGVELLPEGLRV